MQFQGILLGLGAAVAFSVCYIVSRAATARHNCRPLSFFTATHVIMGVAAVPILLLARSPDMPPLRQYIIPVIGVSGFYLVGQMGLLVLLRRVEASRIAPLLAFKLVFTAIITATCLGVPLSGRQWLAVGLCILASLALNYSGTTLPRRAIALLLLTCIGYSLSDMCIVVLMRSLATQNLMRASVVAGATSYVLCGLVGLMLLPFAGGPKQVFRGWTYSVGFSFFWLLSVILLFACFSLIGAVLGTIAQSTRGIISIIIGACLGRLGMDHIEQRTAPIIFMQRLGAAILMTLSVWFFLG